MREIGARVSANSEPKARIKRQRGVGSRERRGSVISCWNRAAERTSPICAADSRNLRPIAVRRAAVTSKKRRPPASTRILGIGSSNAQHLLDCYDVTVFLDDIGMEVEMETFGSIESAYPNRKSCKFVI